MAGLALGACAPGTGAKVVAARGQPDVVVTHDLGGNIWERAEEARRAEREQPHVRIEGVCASACLMHLINPNACVAPQARFFLHRAVINGQPIPRSLEPTFSIANGMYRIHLPPYLHALFDQLEPGPLIYISGRQMIALGARACR